MHHEQTKFTIKVPVVGLFAVKKETKFVDYYHCYRQQNDLGGSLLKSNLSEQTTHVEPEVLLRMVAPTAGFFGVTPYNVTIFMKIMSTSR